ERRQSRGVHQEPASPDPDRKYRLPAIERQPRHCLHGPPPGRNGQSDCGSLPNRTIGVLLFQGRQLQPSDWRGTNQTCCFSCTFLGGTTFSKGQYLSTQQVRSGNQSAKLLRVSTRSLMRNSCGPPGAEP